MNYKSALVILYNTSFTFPLPKTGGKLGGSNMNVYYTPLQYERKSKE